RRGRPPPSRCGCAHRANGGAADRSGELRYSDDHPRHDEHDDRDLHPHPRRRHAGAQRYDTRRAGPSERSLRYAAAMNVTRPRTAARATGTLAVFAALVLAAGAAAYGSSAGHAAAGNVPLVGVNISDIEP